MNILRECYYTILMDGSVVERNRTTMCRINGVITRYQVYSENKGHSVFTHFKEPDAAVDLFMELSR